MPMYEKGSVRAEPRSKQQERMKKIMKKFLSSLLALTMILSLVIVPANAATTVEATGSFTISGPTTASEGDTVSFSITNPKITYNGTDYPATVSGYQWTGLGDSVTANVETYSGIVGNQTLSINCTVTLSATVGSGQSATPVTVENCTLTTAKSVTVTTKQAAFEAAIQTVVFRGREYPVTNSVATVYYFKSEEDLLTNNCVTVKADAASGITSTYIVGENKSSGTLTASKEGLTNKAISLIFTQYTPTAPTITADYGTDLKDTRVGQKTVLTATYSKVSNANLTYKWYIDNNADANATSSSFNCKNLSQGTHTIAVEAYEGGVLAAKSSNFTLEVKADPYTVAAESGYKTSMVPGQSQSLEISITGSGVVRPAYSVAWASSKTDVADFTAGSKNSKTGVLVANNKSGYTTVTATVTFENKDYTVTFDRISVSAADATLDEITNGKSDYLSDTSLKDVVAKAINKSTDSKLSGSDISTIKVATAGFPSHVTLYEDEVKSANKITSTTKDLTTVNDLYFDTDAGYIGTAELNLNVTLKAGGNGTIAVTLYIPVVGNETIKDTVTGTSANKEVTFTNDDYDYLYYSYSKPTYEGYFNGNNVSDFEGPVKENKTVTVPASKFSGSNKTVTLYVVGVDSKGVASTGTITVSQKSYDINYNVVAGKSVSFSQKDFEDFLENYADDNGDYNSRKDELSFDHAVLTSSVPSTKSEGTLYDGSTAITSSNKSKTKMTDMDKVSFDTVSKPSKDTITLTFRVYGEIEKPNSRKPDKVNYDVNVVISVVKEDITYTVGIDDTVQMTARDFVNFLQDARTSYRKAELDYVKFDVSGKNVSSYAYGGLYRSYSSYSTGKLADSTDKFYYEPSRTQYDLADVAYHTTRWAEAGKTVYIPFTVYGTKGEEASGTMAITIAQTMNFIDVKASDFFYEPVKWAVNNKITNGTSSTTFSPYKNCNRAEIVTFLWRAAGSPEPTVTRNPFTDVNSVRDASYYKAILWASQKGITAGSTATTFSPYQECTRSQIVTFLYRYAGKPSGYYSNPFKDVSSVNEASYYNAILWAVGKGITQGTSTTTFSPYASCTRGEAVTFLYRYVNGVK